MTNRQHEDHPFRYEKFLRWAFGLTLGGEILERYGDPAGSADTDSFTDRNLAGVKASTAYAMMIYKDDLTSNTNTYETGICDDVNESIKKVINAPDLQTISDLIAEFEDLFVNRYYTKSNGRITFTTQSPH